MTIQSLARVPIFKELANHYHLKALFTELNMGTTPNDKKLESMGFDQECCVNHLGYVVASSVTVQ